MLRRDFLKGLVATASGLLIPQTIIKRPPVVFDLGRKVHRRIWAPSVVCYDAYGRPIAEIEAHYPEGPQSVIARLSFKKAVQVCRWQILSASGVLVADQPDRVLVNNGDTINFCFNVECWSNA